MIIFFGPQGSGKSTQIDLVAKKFGFKVFYPGAVYRASGDPEILKIINGGNLVPDEITNNLAMKFLNENGADKTILDGYPRNQNQAEYLVNYNQKSGAKIDLLIQIDVPEDEVIKRMLLRGRADDMENEIRRRLGIYHKETQPLVDFLARESGAEVVRIDGVGSVDDIHGRIGSELAKREII